MNHKELKKKPHTCFTLLLCKPRSGSLNKCPHHRGKVIAPRSRTGRSCDESFSVFLLFHQIRKLQHNQRICWVPKGPGAWQSAHTLHRGFLVYVPAPRSWQRMGGRLRDLTYSPRHRPSYSFGRRTWSLSCWLGRDAASAPPSLRKEGEYVHDMMPVSFVILVTLNAVCVAHTFSLGWDFFYSHSSLKSKCDWSIGLTPSKPSSFQRSARGEMDISIVLIKHCLLSLYTFHSTQTKRKSN